MISSERKSVCHMLARKLYSVLTGLNSKHVETNSVLTTRYKVSKFHRNSRSPALDISRLLLIVRDISHADVYPRQFDAF